MNEKALYMSGIVKADHPWKSPTRLDAHGPDRCEGAEAPPDDAKNGDTPARGGIPRGVGSGLPRLALGIVLGLVALKLALHLATNAFGPYEFHRDEFLYFAMGEHLRLWHMDFPPAIAIISESVRSTLGDSLLALRLAPALASAALVWLAALTARELGGARYAQGLAALCVLANVLFLRSGNLFQPVVFDQLWWTLGLFSLVKLGRTGDPRWWLAFGVSCGLGLLSKFSVLVFGLAVLLALVVTDTRRWLRTRWPWSAALIALAIGSPSIVGQILLGFPVLDQMGVLRRVQLGRVTPAAFISQQFLFGLGTFIALAGLGAFLLRRDWRPYRLVGWSCLWAFVLLLALKGKSYYAGPIYPVLFGAGAPLLERVRHRVRGPLIRWGAVALVAGYGLALLPVGLPILPPRQMEHYLAAMNLELATRTNVGARERLPQDYADMLNWEEQVRTVARVYEGLAVEERERAVILASNYGEAGAIDFYGPRYGLPDAIAYTGTYWFFGPGELPGEVVIAHGFERDDLTDHFESVMPAAHVTHPYAVAEERDLTLYVCRGPETTLQAIWPSLAGEH